MSYTRINPTVESQGALVFKGTLSSSITDLNNATTPGIYQLDGADRTNVPSGTYKWRFLVVLSVGAIKEQFVFGNASVVFFRGYSGSPGVWGSWHAISST